MTNSTCQAPEKRLMELSSPGIVPGLDRLNILLPMLGNPQNAFPAVHVVGTNGKGSTSATLASILTAAGSRVALYTSPHLVSFGERLVICGKQITIEKWNSAIDKIKTVLDNCAALKVNRPTYFELITAAAFLIIAGEEIDIAVIEAGLGGRLDATNMLGDVVLTLIAPIGMDHMDYLGDDLLSIAAEKFAVMREGVPAFFSWCEPALEEEFYRVAEEKGAIAFLLREICSVHDVKTSLSGTDFIFDGYSRLSLYTPLVGLFQAENAALAVCGAYELSKKYAQNYIKIVFAKITDEAIRVGVANTCWRGRLEVVADSPPTILDGAHNPHAMERLVETLSVMTWSDSLNIVLAMMKDKDVRKVLQLLKPLTPTIYCTQVPDLERSMSTKELNELARESGLSVAGEYADPLDALKAARLTGNMTVCCGSLFLVGYMKGHIDEICGV